jgi:hypothetical protein
MKPSSGNASFQTGCSEGHTVIYLDEKENKWKLAERSGKAL